jgi:hypothetical protein
MLTAACALAGLPAVVDPERRRFLAARERELGIRIPAAVAEWYAIDGAVEHLVQGSSAIIVRLEQLGMAADGGDLAAGRLLLASDHQDCCDWLVDLASTLPAGWDVPLPGLASPTEHQAAGVKGADPPVWLSEHNDPADTWSLATPRFSAYVYAEAWDIAFGAPGLVVHRFERPGQRVRVAAHSEESEWWLAADSAEPSGGWWSCCRRATMPLLGSCVL